MYFYSLLKPAQNILLQPGDCAWPKILVLWKYSLIHVAVNRASAEACNVLYLMEAKKPAHGSIFSLPVDIGGLKPLQLPKGPLRPVQDCVPMTPFYTTDGVEQVKQAHAAARAQLERHRAQLNVQQTWDKPPPRDWNPTAELELTEEDVQPTGFLNVDVEVQTALFNSFTPQTGTEAPRTKPAKVQQKTDQGFLGSGGTKLAGASTTTVSSLKATQGSIPWSQRM